MDLKRINICLVIRTILNPFGRTDVTSLGHQLALRKLLGEGLSLSANGCICIMILQILDNFYEFLISEYFNEFLFISLDLHNFQGGASAQAAWQLEREHLGLLCMPQLAFYLKLPRFQ